MWVDASIFFKDDIGNYIDIINENNLNGMLWAGNKGGIS